MIDRTGDELVAAIAAAQGRRSNVLPPAQRALLETGWAFDAGFGAEGQAHRSRIGPTAQLGSTTGADSADPTLDPTVPSYKLADDYLDFGDKLDAILMGSFTVQVMFALSAADLTAVRAIMDKGIGIEIRCTLGKPEMIVYFGGGTANRDEYTKNTAIAAGRHVLTITRDTTQARGSRHAMYLDGALAAVAATHTGVLADGSVADVANALRLGVGTANPGNNAVSEIAAIELWPGLLSAAEIQRNQLWAIDRWNWR